MRVALALLLIVGVACGDNEFGEGPHTPLPHVVDAGGPVLASPRWAVVTFPGDPLAGDLEQFLASLGASDYWKTAVGEYGVGPASMVAVRVSDVPPATIDDAGIAAYLDAHLSNPASGWPAPDANTVYAIYYPTTTTVAGACTTYAAYHSSLDLSDGRSVAYAVIPRCVQYAEVPLDGLTAFSTHELVEATTDASVFRAPAYSAASDFAWQERAAGGEIGDMCQAEPGSYVVDPELGHLVQRVWSNAEAAAGHDPCVPHPDGDVYFQAAPDESGTVTLAFSNGLPDVTTTGLHIPVHTTRTIDVRLFSDAPTEPISVSALEWPVDASVEEPADLTLSWDHTTGVNGDTLHLTIAVDADNYGEGHEYVIITAQVGDLQQQWPVAIAN